MSAHHVGFGNVLWEIDRGLFRLRCRGGGASKEWATGVRVGFIRGNTFVDAVLVETSNISLVWCADG